MSSTSTPARRRTAPITIRPYPCLLATPLVLCQADADATERPRASGRSLGNHHEPAAARTARRSSVTIRRALILALAAASAVFIAVQLNDGWGRIRDEPLPGVLPIVGVVALLALGQVALGEAMVSLGAGVTTPFDRRWAFHISQPAKYVPIGVAHAAGSVTALTGRGAARVTAGVLWAVHTGTLVIVGVALGLLGSPAFGWWAPLALLGPVTLVCLDHRVLLAIVRAAGRFVEVLSRPSLVPPQRRLNRCAAWAATGIVLHGLAYAVLVEAAGISMNPLAAVAGYCLALGVSIATPLPAGLGAREALLLAFSTAPAGDAIVPIVLVRLLLVGVELVLWFIASTHRRPPAADAPH